MPITGKYIKTAGERDSVELLMKYVEELRVSLASVQSVVAALATKINADSADTGGDADYVGASTAAPAAISTFLE